MQKDYALGDEYRAFIIWSDHNQGYYFGRVEQLHEQGESYEFRELSGIPELTSIVEFVKAAAYDLVGIEDFDVPEEDLEQLRQAPTTTAAPQTKLYPIDMLDTDYAAMLVEQAEQERRLRHVPITLCVEDLERLKQQITTEPVENDSEEIERTD